MGARLNTDLKQAARLKTDLKWGELSPWCTHLVKIAHDFGLCRLVSCATGECKHAALKTASHNTNHANIELDMFTRQHIQQALTFLVSGGHKHIPNASSIWSNALLTSLRGDPMWKELLALTGPSTNYISSDFSDKKSDLSQNPTSPSVVLSDLLGQDTLSHLPSFSSASFPDREEFCSQVFLGEFYYVHHSTFQFARADAILQLPNNDVVCRLISFHGPRGDWPSPLLPFLGNIHCPSPPDRSLGPTCSHRPHLYARLVVHHRAPHQTPSCLCLPVFWAPRHSLPCRLVSVQ